MILSQNLNVLETTKWVKTLDLYNPFQLQVHVVVPLGTVADYTLESVTLDATQPNPNELSPPTELPIVYEDMENITETKVIMVISPANWFRVVLNSISGGPVYVTITQSGRQIKTEVLQ